jgi:glutathione S-transferase
MEIDNLIAIVTLLSLLTYFWIGYRVGVARGKFGVSAPATTGNEDFERVFRAHQNTLEWLPLYLPSLWLFAFYWDNTLAAVLGLIWIAGRILYATGYAKAAGQRGIGFAVQAITTGVLLFGALGGAVWSLVQAG